MADNIFKQFLPSLQGGTSASVAVNATFTKDNLSQVVKAFMSSVTEQSSTATPEVRASRALHLAETEDQPGQDGHPREVRPIF